MKTETKTIKCWANYYPERVNDQTGKIHLYDTKDNADGSRSPKGITVPCTITLELPIEEKKVTISESEFELAWVNSNTMWDLKKKLFGGCDG